MTYKCCLYTKPRDINTYQHLENDKDIKCEKVSSGSTITFPI